MITRGCGEAVVFRLPRDKLGRFVALVVMLVGGGGVLAVG